MKTFENLYEFLANNFQDIYVHTFLFVIPMLALLYILMYIRLSAKHKKLQERYNTIVNKCELIQGEYSLLTGYKEKYDNLNEIIKENTKNITK